MPCSGHNTAISIPTCALHCPRSAAAVYSTAFPPCDPAVIPSLMIYLGTALLLGGVATRHLLTPEQPARSWLGVGLGLLVIGALLQVWLTLSSVGFTAPGDILDYLMTSISGRATLMFLMGAFVSLAAEIGALSRLALLGGAAMTLWGLAGIGHGATHGDFVRVLHSVHAGAMSFWIAGVFAVFQSKGQWREVARKFKPMALASVAVLVLTGSIMTVNHAGNVLQLPQSNYGLTLIVKLVLVALALGAAVGVRRAVARQKLMQFSLMRELLVLLAVLGVTAFLANTPPPTHVSGGSEHTGH